MTAMQPLPRLPGSSGTARPRVLLVDDHRSMLDRVSAMLADDFDIAGLATDGSQAVDVAHRVAPDVIVLDVNMPGLDGFRTKRALEQAGSRAPVVFLSMVDADDHIDEAFRCGGRGYVLKSRVASDLAGALDQVLHGRVFVPSLTSLSALVDGGGHAMQLYRRRQRFVEGLAAFCGQALQRGDAMCVLATPDVRDGLEHRLRSAGWDVGGPSGHERYKVFDVDAFLSRVMRDGLPDPAVMAEIAAETDHFRRAASESAGGRLTFFGNAVVHLIAGGNSRAAIEIERQWNTLTAGQPIVTLCGYSASCFHDQAPGLWSSACQQHWVVGHASDA
jgi:DNA-binding NarL/FixJ family response regulator